MKKYQLLPFLLQGTLWWVVMKPIFSIFTKFHVEGYRHIQNLPKPVIFAPNHSHSIDAVLLPLALPLWSKFAPVFYVTREGVRYEGWKRFLFTFFNLKHIGAYPIAHDQKNYAVSLQAHERILRDGGSMCIFPEGGTTKDGLIRPAKGGVGHLAASTQSLVVPVLITGTFGLSFKDFLLRENRITITFFPPMQLQANTSLDGDELVNHYRSFGEKVLNVIRVAKNEPEVHI